jgi:DNA gyrase inhibitor GyrI
MHIETKVLPTFHVAYVRNLEGYENGVFSSKISGGFDKAYKWVEAKRLIDQNTLCIGILYDHQDITPSDKRRYDSSITIPAHVTEGSEGISIQDVEGGQYAVCRVEVENAGVNSFDKAIAEMDQGFE